MSKGYIAIAQNNDKYDYLKMAYALALSLKATQKENKFCVCVDEKTKYALTDKYKEVFDHVVDIHGMMMQVVTLGRYTTNGNMLT